MLVGRGGVEPPTYHFSGDRSYQLSYLPKQGATLPETHSVTESEGIEVPAMGAAPGSPTMLSGPRRARPPRRAPFV